MKSLTAVCKCIIGPLLAVMTTWNLWVKQIAQKTDLWAKYKCCFIKGNQCPRSLITSVFQLVELPDILHINMCSTRGVIPGWWLDSLLVRWFNGVPSGSSSGSEQRRKNPLETGKLPQITHKCLSEYVPIVHKPDCFPVVHNDYSVQFHLIHCPSVN